VTATVSYSMGLYVTDVDAVLERAAVAGATVREAAQNFVSGEVRSIIDPSGIRWSPATRRGLPGRATPAAEWAASQTA
jgi:PhnB protein